MVSNQQAEYSDPIYLEDSFTPDSYNLCTVFLAGSALDKATEDL